MGARVTAVASSAEKLAAAEAHGAERLLNHRDGDLRSALRASLPDGPDDVDDPVGGDLAEPPLRSLRWAGSFVTVTYRSDEPRGGNECAISCRSGGSPHL